MQERLTVAAALPEDRARATLVGRAWVPAVDGAVLVGVQDDHLVDLTAVAPTSSALANLPDPAAAVRGAGALPRIAPLASVLANSAEGARDPALPWLLAPCDLQAIKAAGVTFVASMLERVIEEQARGDPAKAECVRGVDRRHHRRRPRAGAPGFAGSGAAEGRADRAARLWSQYLEVGDRPGRRDLHQGAADVRRRLGRRGRHPPEVRVEQSRARGRARRSTATAARSARRSATT